MWQRTKTLLQYLGKEQKCCLGQNDKYLEYFVYCLLRQK